MYITFHGNSTSSPMLWTVEQDDDSGAWYVLESYNNGASWIRNCEVRDEQDGWDFVSAWFAQWYEGK